MRVAIGTYTGNGADGRAMSGVGFQPDVLIIKRTTLAAGGPAVLRTASMTGDASKPCQGALASQTDQIQSLDADGFTLGTHLSVNADTVTYYWMAFQAHASDLAYGSYAGNGADNREISAALAPAFALVASRGAQDPVFFSNEHAATWATYFHGDSDSVGDRIQSLGADGFQVGTNADVNAAATTYDWVAIKEVAGFLQILSHTGNGADSRNLTGFGLNPDLALSWRANTDIGDFSYKCWHTESMGDATDTSQIFDAGNALTNGIQQLITDGVQVGTHASINANGTGYAILAATKGNSQAAAPAAASPDLVVQALGTNRQGVSAAVVQNRRGPGSLTGNRGGTTSASVLGVQSNRGSRSGGAVRPNRLSN